MNNYQSMAAEELRWVSWEQRGDEAHPATWPPPPEVLAFWLTGSGGGEGAAAYCTVVALVRAPSERAATAPIRKAWMPGIRAWRFNRAYGIREPPGDRFPPPSWAIKLGRWPWISTSSPKRRKNRTSR